jgi:hypothetical protein
MFSAVSRAAISIRLTGFSRVSIVRMNRERSMKSLVHGYHECRLCESQQGTDASHIEPIVCVSPAMTAPSLEGGSVRSLLQKMER